MKLLVFAFLIFRILLIPILYPLCLLVPSLRKRLFFELRNFQLRKRHKRADLCIEVSSEGELQQIAPFLELMLANNKKVELIFCSDSVENQVLRLADKYDNLDVFRFPLVGYIPFIPALDAINWVSAKTLILVRYDFFPQLLWLGLSKKRKFVLTSATSKNIKNDYFKNIFNSFDFILASTEQDKQEINQILPDKDNVFNYDFRVLFIQQRLMAKSEKLSHLRVLLDKYAEQDKKKNIIFGSYWPYEVDFVEKLSRNGFKCLLVPHLLDEKHLSEIKSQLSVREIEHTLIDKNNLKEPIEDLPSVVILNLKGVLCELYSEFFHAFVGGGHGRSVHSLLEPYLAGCHVYCGPKTYRSTEYNLVSQVSPQHIHIVKTPGDILDATSESSQIDIDVQTRNHLMQDHSNRFDTVVNLLAGLT